MKTVFNPKLFMGTPIPNLESSRQVKAQYQMHRIDRSHPGHQEKTIDLLSVGIAGKNHYFEAKNPPVKGAIKELVVRITVAEKLHLISKKLANHDLEFYVDDAFRPLAVQKHAYEFNFAKLCSKHPDLDHQEVEKMMVGWIAKPPSIIELQEKPHPHSTGAAVDLRLRKISGGILDFGVGREFMFPDYFENESGRRSLSENEQLALMNRRLLYWTMTTNGFVCNPTEWWHFSLFDQMWANQLGESRAIYGSLE